MFAIGQPVLVMDGDTKRQGIIIDHASSKNAVFITRSVYCLTLNLTKIYILLHRKIYVFL